jgi:hypothetical protein
MQSIKTYDGVGKELYILNCTAVIQTVYLLKVAPLQKEKNPEIIGKA